MSALKDTLGVSLQMQRFFCLSFLSAERNDGLNLHSQANLWVCLPKILKSYIFLLLGLETTIIDFTGMKRVKIFNLALFTVFNEFESGCEAILGRNSTIAPPPGSKLTVKRAIVEGIQSKCYKSLYDILNMQ